MKLQMVIKGEFSTQHDLVGSLIQMLGDFHRNL
jgi:hypothetical protein